MIQFSIAHTLSVKVGAVWKVEALLIICTVQVECLSLCVFSEQLVITADKCQ